MTDHHYILHTSIVVPVDLVAVHRVHLAVHRVHLYEHSSTVLDLVPLQYIIHRILVALRFLTEAIPMPVQYSTRLVRGQRADARAAYRNVRGQKSQ